jgi:3-oxoacyl-[acyl-carrier protein] reductase
MTGPGKKRSIIVTGASRGLGREIALFFGGAGDRVLINYHSGEREASAVAGEINHSGGEAFAWKADVRRTADVDAMIRESLLRWGSIDVLINNAGRTRDGIMLRMDEQAWDDILMTNLKGAFHTIRSVSAVMLKQRRGHIINIASITGVQGREGQANYSSSKAALIGLTKAAARELGSRNIQVNAVLPGYLPTAMGEHLSQNVQDRVIRQNCLGRMSDPKEVACFIHHLSLMNNVSGQIFNLDSRII